GGGRHGRRGGPLVYAHLPAAREAEDLREVERLRAGELLDLTAAREAARDEECRRRGVAHRGKQHTLRARHRHFVVRALVAPRARHAAAAAHGCIDDETDALEQLLLGLEPVRRPAVAVAVKQCATGELRRLVPRLAHEELGEVEGLLAET